MSDEYPPWTDGPNSHCGWAGPEPLDDYAACTRLTADQPDAAPRLGRYILRWRVSNIRAAPGVKRQPGWADTSPDS